MVSGPNIPPPLIPPREGEGVDCGLGDYFVATRRCRHNQKPSMMGVMMAKPNQV